MTRHLAPSSPSDPLVGQLVENRYRVLQCIGRGGMGSVYLAEHVRIRRQVALKVLHGAVAAAPGLVARFHREAVAAAAVGNEHVVSVTDMGQLDNGAFYIVLEYLQGADLNWRVANSGPLPIATSLHIALQLCEALAAVHAAGIVHRDLKPENLFLCERTADSDFLKVLDFGVCKMQDSRVSQHPLTGTGAALGTPHYMAPEQFEGHSDIDQRADLYAVGGIMYFMLAGDAPFDAPSVPRLFARICFEPCPALQATRADVPAELDAIVQRCLAKRPEQRYASAAELRAALLPLSAAYPYQPSGVQPALHARHTLPHGGMGERAWEPIAGRNNTGYVATLVSAPELSAASSPEVSQASEIPGKRRWPLRAVLALTVALGATLMAAAVVRLSRHPNAAIESAHSHLVGESDTRAAENRVETATGVRSQPNVTAGRGAELAVDASGSVAVVSQPAAAKAPLEARVGRSRRPRPETSPPHDSSIEVPSASMAVTPEAASDSRAHPNNPEEPVYQPSTRDIFHMAPVQP